MKAPGFNPCAYEVKTWFQRFCFFKFNLYRYEKAESDAAAEAARKKEFNEMNRHEKLRHSFQAMDRDGSGSLDFDEMLFGKGSTS